MLVMARRSGEVIDIGPLPTGEMISVQIIRTGLATRVGIEAPPHIPVHRREIREAIEREGKPITPGHKDRESDADIIDRAQQQIDTAGHDGGDRIRSCPLCGVDVNHGSWASWLMGHLTDRHGIQATEAYAMAMGKVREEHAEKELSYRELEAAPVGVRIVGAGPLTD